MPDIPQIPASCSPAMVRIAPYDSIKPDEDFPTRLPLLPATICSNSCTWPLESMACRIVPIARFFVTRRKSRLCGIFSNLSAISLTLFRPEVFIDCSTVLYLSNLHVTQAIYITVRIRIHILRACFSTVQLEQPCFAGDQVPFIMCSSDIKCTHRHANTHSI